MGTFVQRANPVQLDRFASMCQKWLEGADPRLGRSGAQTLGIMAETEGARFGHRVPVLLPQLLSTLQAHSQEVKFSLLCVSFWSSLMSNKQLSCTTSGGSGKKAVLAQPLGYVCPGSLAGGPAPLFDAYLGAYLVLSAIQAVILTTFCENGERFCPSAV